MRFTNGKIFINGAFVDGGIEFDDKLVAVGIDVKDDDSDLDLQGDIVIPGLIDIHTHGGVGCDASDGITENLEKLGQYYAKEGVTSWLPTTMTLKEPELTKAFSAIRSFQRSSKSAKAVGIHMEGPFLSYAKRGAQNPENLHQPDIEMFQRLYEASGKMIRLVTIAPEEANAIPFISEVSRLCTVSLGHTTADYETSMKAFQAGASHATHLFNGMPGLHHRQPGVIAAAFDSNATVELIADGFHVAPSMMRLTHRLFDDHLCLISDSLRCAGMQDGDYELGGQPITLKDGKATLSGTDTLAGSSIHLMEGLRRCVSFGIPLEKAILAATLQPAKAIRMDNVIGSITAGKFADFVILDERLHVKAVYINGQCV